MSALPSKGDMCGAVADVCYGPEADMCAAISDVRFTSNFDRKSRHRFIERMVLWLATEEFDHAITSNTYAIHTQRCPVE